MEGIEPSFPRCDRGVLPLHHIPWTTDAILFIVGWVSTFSLSVF